MKVSQNDIISSLDPAVGVRVKRITEWQDVDLSTDWDVFISKFRKKNSKTGEYKWPLNVPGYKTLQKSLDKCVQPKKRNNIIRSLKKGIARACNQLLNGIGPTQKERDDSVGDIQNVRGTRDYCQHMSRAFHYYMSFDKVPYDKLTVSELVDQGKEMTKADKSNKRVPTSEVVTNQPSPQQHLLEKAIKPKQIESNITEEIIARIKALEINAAETAEWREKTFK